jgi:hypothetical protein
MKFKYIPAVNPTPMLMYQMESNMMAFNGEENIYKKGDFVNGQNHI